MGTRLPHLCAWTIDYGRTGSVDRFFEVLKCGRAHAAYCFLALSKEAAEFVIGSINRQRLVVQSDCPTRARIESEFRCHKRQVGDRWALPQGVVLQRDTVFVVADRPACFRASVRV